MVLVLLLLIGGSLRNAIPREAVAVVTLAEDDMADFGSLSLIIRTSSGSEYKGVEDSICFTAERIAPCI